MRKLLFGTVLTLSLAAAAVACSKEGQAADAAGVPAGAPSVAPVPEPAATAAADGKQYQAATAPVTIKPGAAGTATLTIKPAKGLHFNHEYPAKFVVTPTAFAKPTKDKLTMKAGDVKIVGIDGVVTIPLQGLAAGAGNVEVVGSFSVCSDEQCYMLRDEKLALQVTVK